MDTTGRVEAVHARGGHGIGKTTVPGIRLVAGIGVEGDAHAGTTVQHRSRVARDPTQPNLRQVHLIQAELHDELRAAGFDVAAGAMGENVTTRGVALLDLPTGTVLHLGDEAVVEVTGLRNPCTQLDGLRPGLMSATLGRTPTGDLVRKAGIMAIVLHGGLVPTRGPLSSDLGCCEFAFGALAAVPEGAGAEVVVGGDVGDAGAGDESGVVGIDDPVVDGVVEDFTWMGSRASGWLTEGS